MFRTRWDAEELTLSLLPWTFLRLPSLLSAHSFLGIPPHCINPRYTYSLLTSDKKILLFVEVEIVALVEDIKAVTMLYIMHCL